MPSYNTQGSVLLHLSDEQLELAIEILDLVGNEEVGQGKIRPSKEIRKEHSSRAIRRARKIRAHLLVVEGMDESQADDLETPFQSEPELTPGTGIMFFGGDEFNGEAVALTVRELMREFDIQGAVGFEVAYTCDQPLPGEFGGTAWIVTKRTTKYMSTQDWMHRQLERYGKAA